MKLTREMIQEIEMVMEETSIYQIYETAIGKCAEEDDSGDSYALMYDIEKEELFILEYATPDSGWAKTAEQQNPWIHIGYVDAEEIIMGDPFERIIEEMDSDYFTEY